jgi:hypothetical protein
MREANMEMWETQQDIRRAVDPRAKSRRPGLTPPEEPERSIQPPSADAPEQNAEAAPDQTDKHD